MTTQMLGLIFFLVAMALLLVHQVLRFRVDIWSAKRATQWIWIVSRPVGLIWLGVGIGLMAR